MPSLPQLARGRTYHLACLAAEITHLLRGSFLAPAPSGAGRSRVGRGRKGSGVGKAPSALLRSLDFNLKPMKCPLGFLNMKGTRSVLCSRKTPLAAVWGESILYSRVGG